MYKAEQEREYIMELFKKGMKKHTGQPIVLYGLGINTEYLIKYNKDQNIIGLMDVKRTGETFFGLPVMSEEEVSNKAKVIVIVARAEVVPIIYERIKKLKKEDIDILTVAGNLVGEEKQYKSDNPYWNQTEDKLKKEIDCHDQISFDIFDTLIMRKILRPDDLFEIMQTFAEKLLGRDYSFRFYRLKAAEQMYKEKVSPCIGEIYDCVQKLSHITDEEKAMLQKMEFETEKKFLCPREKMVELLKYALQQRKRVYLLSDMYYGKEQVKEILDKYGINGYEEIIVSSDVQKTKWPKGDLFQYYCEVTDKTKKKLHIGDNLGADIECAEKHGISAFYIMNAYEMIVQSEFSSILAHVQTPLDSVLLGMVVAKVLNNPFVLAKEKGKLYIERLEDIGYIGYGALLTGFTEWVLKKYQGRSNAKLLFLARDGYVPVQVYQKFVHTRRLKDVPEGIYTLASRRSLAIPAIKDEESLRFAVSRVDMEAKYGEVLLAKFGIEAELTDDMAKVPVDKSKLTMYIEKYKDEILLNAKKEREAYLSYLEGIGIKKGDDVIVFDTQTIGTSAFYMKNLLESRIELVCIVLLNAPDYSLHDELHSFSYIGNDTLYLPKYAFTANSNLNDSILTSPKPQFIKFLSKENPQFAEMEPSQINYDKINKAQMGIILFVEEYLTLIPYEIKDKRITAKLTDSLNELLCLKTCVIKSELKKIFAVVESFTQVNYYRKAWK